MNVSRRGFTIIEIIVVVAIFGLLASIVMASVKSAKTKSQIAVAKSDMATFAKILAIAQGESGKTFLKMSQDGGASIPNCSECVAACQGGADLRNIPTSHACYAEWAKVIAGVQMNASGLGNSLNSLLRDQWGSPYLVDQNQGESGNCAGVDGLKSVGPDGVRNTSDDIPVPVAMPTSPICP
jgi:prepilin-type N-terminal cleavage/methylation domain-containing protein